MRSMEAHIVTTRKGLDFTADDARHLAGVVECLSPRPTIQRFVARWREEETGQWDSIAILAYTQNDALGTIVDLVGHTNVKVTPA